MKKDKTKDGTALPDEFLQSPEVDQPEQESVLNSSANEEISGFTTQPPQPLDPQGVSEQQSELLPRADKVDEVVTEETPPEKSERSEGELLTALGYPAGEKLQKEPEEATASANLILGPHVISPGIDLYPYIFPSTDDSAIASGAPRPPAVILDDIGLKQVLGRSWSEKFISGLDETGRLVGAQRFENDPEKIFRKGRKPGVVYAVIERLMEGKIDRRRIAESTRAYGAELELNQESLLFHLNYTSRAQIGRLPEKADRILLAREMHEKKLSVDSIKKRVAELLRKDSLDDHATGQALLREIHTAGNLLSDEDMKEFVQDKKRLKTLTPQERLRIRTGIEGARKNVNVTGGILNNLEDVLWDIEREEKENKAQPVENGFSEAEMRSDN